jgi:small subunit ribosomal protein S7
MRKSSAKERLVLPDPKFGDILVTKFVNNLMLDGKKSVAFNIFYDAIDAVGSKLEEDVNALEVFKKGLSNVTPGVEVRSKRVGGATFQIPVPIRESRKQSMGMKWLIGYARKRNEKSMAQKLAAEILAASKEEGAAFKKKEDTHRMAEANKAFAHFRV